MSRRPRSTVRQRGTFIRPPRMTAEHIAELAYRLTTRDRDILNHVWEHRVLTTDQLTTLYFPTPERARQRLNQLHHLHTLQRFRPWTPVGSRPWHWILGPAGAHTLATERGQTLTEFGYRQDTTTAIAVSPRLTHQIGINDFYVHLHTHARHLGDGTELTRWWPEHRCAALWGDLVRPDAYGRWTQPTDHNGRTTPATLDFFLEHDTGTEPLPRVAAKLAGYYDLAETTGTVTPVLFWLPSARRETNLRKLIGTPEIPTATAVHNPNGPTRPIWQPAGTTGTRHHLIDLAHIWQVTPRPDTGPTLHPTEMA